MEMIELGSSGVCPECNSANFSRKGEYLVCDDCGYCVLIVRKRVSIYVH